MKRVVILLALGAIAQPASAQSASAQQQFRYQNNNPRDVTTRGDSFLSYNRTIAERGIQPAEDELECLRERRTGLTVCHKRAQWVEIARRIEAGRSWR